MGLNKKFALWIDLAAAGFFCFLIYKLLRVN